MLRMTIGGLLGMAYGSGLLALGIFFAGAGHGSFGMALVLALPMGVSPLFWGVVGALAASNRSGWRGWAKRLIAGYYVYAAVTLIWFGDAGRVRSAGMVWSVWLAGQVLLWWWLKRGERLGGQTTR